MLLKESKSKKAKKKNLYGEKVKKSVKNPRTSILVPYGMPYTHLYGWYQQFAHIAQCPGREASLQQALALPQEVRSRREALPTSTLLPGLQNRPLKHYHKSLSPTQLSVAMKCFYFLFFKITRTECWLIQKYTFLLEVITLSLMLLNIHLLTATRKSNYLARKEQEVLK